VPAELLGFSRSVRRSILPIPLLCLAFLLKIFRPRQRFNFPAWIHVLVGTSFVSKGIWVQSWPRLHLPCAGLARNPIKAADYCCFVLLIQPGMTAARQALVASPCSFSVHSPAQIPSTVLCFHFLAVFCCNKWNPSEAFDRRLKPVLS
jgi:hypothetical protein